METHEESRRNPGGFRRLLMSVAIVAIFAPTVYTWWLSGSEMAGYRSISLSEPVVLSQEDVVRLDSDPYGIASVLATLASWSGAELDHDGIVSYLNSNEDAVADRQRIRSTFASFGFGGDWLEVEPLALFRLRTPFIAVVSDPRPRLSIVRSVRQGLVYLFDPTRGNVVLERDEFAGFWDGLVFALRSPPSPPAVR